MASNPRTYSSQLASATLATPYPNAPFCTDADFGLTGSGDETAKFQAMIDALNTNAGGVRTAYLTKPKYNVSTLNMTNRNGVRLLGAGGFSNANGAVEIIGNASVPINALIYATNLSNPSLTNTSYMELSNVLLTSANAGAYNYGFLGGFVTYSRFDHFITNGDWAINSELFDFSFENLWLQGGSQQTRAQKSAFMFGTTGSNNNNVFIGRLFIAHGPGGAGAAIACNLGDTAVGATGTIMIGCDYGTADIGLYTGGSCSTIVMGGYSEGADTVVKLSGVVGGPTVGFQWLGGQASCNDNGKIFSQGAGALQGIRVQGAQISTVHASHDTIYDLGASTFYYGAHLSDNNYVGSWLHTSPTVAATGEQNFGYPEGNFTWLANGGVRIPGTGGLVIPNGIVNLAGLPTVAGASGTLWVDTGAGNVVKRVP